MFKDPYFNVFQTDTASVIHVLSYIYMYINSILFTDSYVKRSNE